MHLLLLHLMACSAEEEAAEPAAVTEAPAAPQKQLPKDLTSKSKNLASRDILAPSPEETRKTVEKAGLTTALGSLVPERSFTFEGISKDQVAIRTGVSLSDMILTIKERPKEQLLANIKAINEGLKLMGAGEGLLGMLDHMHLRFNNDELSRQELLDELESIVSMSVPEHGFSKDDRTGPLLQAGSWVAGVNLVSQAILKEERVDTAKTLLRLETVADYFLGYVDTEGSDKAGTEVLGTMKASLLKLKEIASKQDIQKSDVEAVVSETGKLLELI